jgi:hypothetical protein
MSRSGGDRTRRMTDEEVAEHARQNLQTIRDLSALYDKGSHYIAFTLATEVHKFLTTSRNVRLRGSKRFPRLQDDYTERNLLNEHKLISFRVYSGSSSVPSSLECRPAFPDSPFTIKPLKFREWWDRDVIFRASAAPLGWKNPITVPVQEVDQVPYHERRRLTRRTFVEQTRNKFGAHLDEEIPELLDELQRKESFGIILAVNINGTIFNTADGSLHMRVGPAAAMMRQIAHELLVAYEVSDPADAV